MTRRSSLVRNIHTGITLGVWLTFSMCAMGTVVHAQSTPKNQSSASFSTPTTQTSSSPTPMKEIHWSPLNFAQALKQARLQNRSIFLDMYATWCGPCKRYERKVFTQPRVATYVHQHFIPLKRDGYKGEGRVLARKFNCVTYPCILVIDKHGEEIERITKYKEASPFLARLDDIRKGKDTLGSLLPQLKAQPNNNLLRFRIGYRLAYRGDARCIQHLRAVAKNPPRQYPWLASRSLYVLGRIYYRNTKRDWASTAKTFQEFLRLYPRHKRANRVAKMLRGALYRLQRQQNRQ